MNTLEALFNQALASHSLWVVALAFVAGVVSSMLPCAIAMLPVLIGYVGGYVADSKWEVFRQVCMFILGMALVMTVLGIAATLLGVTFGVLVGSAWYYAIGVVAILMALHLLEFIHIPFPQFVTQLPESKPGKIVAPFMLGVTFGAASSPCGTPFLAAILGLMSQEHNIVLGGISLFCYALGQGAILLVIGLFTGLLKHLAILRHVGRIFTKLSGILFLLVGLMLLAAGAGVLPSVLQFFHLL